MRLLLTLLLLAAFTTAFAQRNKKDEESTPAETSPVKETTATASKHMEVYKLARSYNDFRAAATALYYQLADEPDNMALKDSLCVMYFAMGANVQAIALGNEILENEESNQRIMEIVAISYQNLGALKEALENYEKLYQQSKSAFHLYQIAVIQYTLKRTYECQLSLGQLINHPDAAKEKVAITIDRQRQQQVNIKAAAYNVLGVMQKEAGNKEEARKSFEAAAAADAEFVLPKANIAAMDKEDKEGN